MCSVARAAKRHSENLIGSILKLEDLAECIVLSDVNGFIVELDDPTGQVNFGTLDIPITISYLNGSPFLRGRYLHINHAVNIHAAGDDEENILFTLTLSGQSRLKTPTTPFASPKSPSFPQHEIAKLKHKTGITVYRINTINNPQTTWTRHHPSDLQIIQPNEKLPVLDMRLEKSCGSALMHWLGLIFDNGHFICYKKDQMIGTVYPKMSCGYMRYAYVVKFNNVPSPVHISKTIVLASVISLLLTVGPINIGDEINISE